MVINNIDINSYRKPWTSINFSNCTDDIKLKILSEYNGDFASGIVVCSNIIDRLKSYQLYSDKYSKLNSNCKCRYVLEPYRNNFVFDLYLHDVDEFNIFIIQVTNHKEGEQLVHLIEKIHNQGSKIIVITESKEKFIDYVNSYLNCFLEKEHQQKRSDRLRIIFPGFF